MTLLRLSQSTSGNKKATVRWFSYVARGDGNRLRSISPMSTPFDWCPQQADGDFLSSSYIFTLPQMGQRCNLLCGENPRLELWFKSHFKIVPPASRCPKIMCDGPIKTYPQNQIQRAGILICIWIKNFGLE